MKGLMCTTCNCEHNRNCRCLAGIVNFNKRGACDTRRKRDGLPRTGNVAIEAARDFEYGMAPDVLVKCDCVDCTYNRNRVCACESIEVGDSMIKTRCFTKRTD